MNPKVEAWKKLSKMFKLIGQNDEFQVVAELRKIGMIKEATKYMLKIVKLRLKGKELMES